MVVASPASVRLRCPICGSRRLGCHPGWTSAALASTEQVASSRAIPGYRVRHVLGRGGFGEVVAAERERDGRRVAIKLARSGGLARLDVEAEVLARVGAPWVPELVDRGTLLDGTAWIAMERVTRSTLAEVLARAPAPLPLEDVARLARAILQSLDALHTRGWLHLDLKPENVFVSDHLDDARLFDFGLARHIGATNDASPEAFAGTAEYMAPEACAGQRSLDERADLYALAVILYELIADRPPFVGPSEVVHQAHLTLRPPPLPASRPISPALARAIGDALSKDASKRPRGAAELRARLDEGFEAEVDPLRPPSPSPELPGARAPSKRSVGVVFLDLRRSAAQVLGAIAPLEATLAHSSRGRAALVFDGLSIDNPVRRALRAAELLLQSDAVGGAIVDVATVNVQTVSGRPPRYLSPQFADAARYPRPDAPRVPWVTRRAMEALPDEAFEPCGGELGSPITSASTQDLARDELVGREEVLEAVVAATAELRAIGAPTLVSIIGARGMGKTHFAATLARALEVKVPGAQLVELRAKEAIAGDSEGCLRDLLRLTHDIAPSADLDPAARAAIFARLQSGPAGELWPAVALGLGLLEPTAPELRAFAASPGVLRTMLVRAAGEGLRALARCRPLLLLVDDAHFADDASLGAIEYATLAEAGAPIWACLVARPELELAHPHLGERAERRARFELGPLAPEDAEVLCRRLLAPAENVPKEAIARLVERAERAPLLIEELARGLKRAGVVRRPANGGSWYLATDEIDHLPDLPLLDWLARRELAALSPDLANHARLLALLGSEVTEGEIEGVLSLLVQEGVPLPLDAGVATRALVARGLLVRAHSGAIRFRQELVRAEIAASVPVDLRTHVHRAAFAHYGDPAHGTDHHRLPLFAHHAAACGRIAEARETYLLLAERARARHAYLEAERIYTLVLELAGDDSRTRQLVALGGRASMRYRIGRFQDALADFAHARDVARSLGLLEAEVKILLDHASALDWLNDSPSSSKLVTEAAELVRAAGITDRAIRAELEMAQGRSLFRVGRWGDSRAALTRAASLAETVGDEGYETLVISLLMLAAILPNMGHIDEAEAVIERATQLSKERGDQLHLASALNDRRNVRIARRDVAGAVSDQLAFMRIGRELGLVLPEYYAEYNVGELLYQSGELAAAEEHARRAIELERRHPEVAGRPIAALLLARISIYSGRVDVARALAAEIRALVDRARDEGRPSGVLQPSEEVLLAMIELATSDFDVVAWRDLTERSARDSIEQEPIEVLEMMGLSALRHGERDRGRDALDAALRVAGRIPNIMQSRVEHALEENVVHTLPLASHQLSDMRSDQVG